jgi:hypothetical protein
LPALSLDAGPLPAPPGLLPAVALRSPVLAGRSAVRCTARRLAPCPAPVFLGFTADAWRVRVLELEPVRRPARSLARSQPLRDNSSSPILRAPLEDRQAVRGAPGVGSGAHLVGSSAGCWPASPCALRYAPDVGHRHSIPEGRRRRGTPGARSACGGAVGRQPRPSRRNTLPRHRSGRTGLGRRLVQPAFSRAWYLIHQGGKHRRKNNDQVNCCCWLCRSRRNFGASNNTSAGSSAGRHDHASSLGMRPV